MAQNICKIRSCENPVAARQLCWKHYMRMRRHGRANVNRRTYRNGHRCRYCGTSEPGDFYPNYKSICKKCRKLRQLGYV